MATRLNDLPLAASLSVTDQILVSQEGQTRRATVQQFNAQVPSGGGGGGSGPSSTDSLAEGTTNLYFTTARARASLTVAGALTYNPATGVLTGTATAYTLPAATSGALGGVKANTGGAGLFVNGIAADGSLTYGTPAGGGGGTTPANTDALSEGTTNLYFTQARARGSVSATGSLSYNSATGVISYTAPTLAAVATSGSAADLSTGTLPAARLPAFTGDATSSAGSSALTLATVNANVGSFTYATLTLDAKGRVTAASSGAAPPAVASASDLRTLTDNTKFLSASTMASAMAFGAPTWAASMALDWSANGFNQTITATGNTTLTGPFTGGKDGEAVVVEYLQDATGSRTLALNTTYFKIPPALGAITASTTAGTRDKLYGQLRNRAGTIVCEVCGYDKAVP